MYIHELPAWPAFEWSREQLVEPLAAVRHQQGRLFGHMEGLGFALRQEAILGTLTADILKTSEIEGERLNLEQVRSSVARKLGIPHAAVKPADRHVEGIVEMMLDATGHYGQALTAERLYSWHAALFPTGRSGLLRIKVGQWRDDTNAPMKVVSGPVGRERTHFEAPPAKRVNREMKKFLRWFNAKPDTDPVLKAALAHLWFVTIHPFEDGNGRIARAVADMALARSEESPQRFYSMSSQLQAERADYYRLLETTQKGSLDVTPWMLWFLGCLGRSIEASRTALHGVMEKARFWEALGEFPWNERQRLVLNLLLEGFDGKLTTSKYAKLAKCSQDTALRDILPLVGRGVLEHGPGGGRSTGYSIASRFIG